jgi:hypothetical protein
MKFGNSSGSNETSQDSRIYRRLSLNIAKKFDKLSCLKKLFPFHHPYHSLEDINDIVGGTLVLF